jgi:hypothetical protein
MCARVPKVSAHAKCYKAHLAVSSDIEKVLSPIHPTAALESCLARLFRCSNIWIMNEPSKGSSLSEMGIEKGIITESAKSDSPLSDAQQQYRESFLFRRSPLWLCLLLALIVRVWLVYHTHGVIDGDESMVSIQAQHILHGELSVYFFSQAYMGSFEAYLMTPLFALAGASVWTLRAEPVLFSLLLVWLTWNLSAILADAATLPPQRERLIKLLMQELNGTLPGKASSLSVILGAILLEEPMFGPWIRIDSDRPSRSLELLLHLCSRLRRLERVILREVAEVCGL